MLCLEPPRDIYRRPRESRVFIFGIFSKTIYKIAGLFIPLAIYSSGKMNSSLK